MGSVLSDEDLVFRGDGGATEGSWDWTAAAGRCWVPRHDAALSQDCSDF